MSDTKKLTAKEVADKFCQEITQKFIELMSTGVMPWTSGVVGSSRPINFFSQKLYSGINWLILNKLPFKVPYYLTFNQARMLKLQVKEGSHGVPIVVFKAIYYDKQGNKVPFEVYNNLSPEKKREIRKYPFLSKSIVFNIEQCVGTEKIVEEYVPFAPSTIVNSVNDNCQMIVNMYDEGPEIIDGRSLTTKSGIIGRYSPEHDTISIPGIETFVSSEMYYKTLFREMVRSTGHEKRLNRNSFKRFDKFGAFEMMVSEIGAAILCKTTHIDNDKLVNDSAYYIKEWIKEMENDPQYILKASALAQKAIDYILKGASELTFNSSTSDGHPIATAA